MQAASGSAERVEPTCRYLADAASLPAAAHRTPEEVTALRLRLHDAQSCVAREYGFASWTNLILHVEADAFGRGDRASAIRRWLGLAYGGDVTGTYDAPRPRLAAHLREEQPTLFTGDVSVACAAGDIAVIGQAMATDSEWINRPSGPLKLPSLIAVTHSRLGQLPEFITRLRACAQLLL